MELNKSFESKNFWWMCKNCNIFIHTKDQQNHIKCEDLNEDNFDWAYSFVKNNILYSYLDISNNLKENKKQGFYDDDMLYVSKNVMQLMDMKIGDPVLLQLKQFEDQPIIKTIWQLPAYIHKSISTVFIHPNAIRFIWKPTDLNNLDNLKLTPIKLKIIEPELIVQFAKSIQLELVNSDNNSREKFFQLNNSTINEFITKRIMKCYDNQLLTKYNLLNMIYFGKRFVFSIKQIKFEQNDNETIETFERSCEDVENQKTFDENEETTHQIKNKITDLEKSFDNLKLNNSSTILFKINKNTKVEIVNKIDNIIWKCSQQIAGGTYINILNKIINFAKNYFQNQNNISSVVLYGFNGTGKTTILKNVASYFSEIHKMVFIDEYYYYKCLLSSSNNDLDTNFKTLYDNCINDNQTILIIDNIETICPSSTKQSENERRSSCYFIKFLEMLREKDAKVFVLVACKDLNDLNQSLFKRGRLEYELELAIPNEMDRFEIFVSLLSEQSECSLDDLKQLAQLTPGYVMSDIELLILYSRITDKQDAKISFDNLLDSLKYIKPAAMKQIKIDKPNVLWQDIGGYWDLKKQLEMIFEWPFLYKDQFKHFNINPCRGVLLFGPPGCSKTMFAKALATKRNFNFLSIKGPELFNKYVGESERAIRDLFSKARQAAPSIIFFDEIDALGERTLSSSSNNSVQERVVAQLLTEMDGINQLGDVYILAATNRPDKVDKALLRPGRLTKVFYVPLPDLETRLSILELRLNQMPINKDVIFDLNYFGERLAGCSGAELQAFCNESALIALGAGKKVIDFEDLKAAIELVRPQTDQNLLKLYENFLSKSSCASSKSVNEN